MGAFSTMDLEYQSESGFAPVDTTQPDTLDTEEQTEEQNEAIEDSNKPDEDAGRKAHEEAEAKRKAAHEAKFAERRAKEQAERERVSMLSDDDAMDEAMQHVSKGFEQLTRRNMKDMVSEYVQTMCVSDPAFARNVLNPVKSMINCVKYINNKAREFIRQEMENNDIKPDQNGIYGGDVPDDIVYQWAADYFNDPNAKEDEREDEQFKPKPYTGSKSSGKSKKAKEKATKDAEKKPAEKKAATEAAKKEADDGQMSLLGAA